MFPIAALVFAALESLALWKKWTRLEYVAKPAVMVILFIWLWTTSGLVGAPFWFGIGILLSLTGDVLLMISLDRLFLAGLVAFLLAHAAYLVGFNIPVSEFSIWGLVMAVTIGLGSARITRLIVAPLASKGQARMRIPILIYSTVISLMLLSAMMKLVDVSWDTNAAILVSLGAFLFYLSDIILAWHKFVAPIQNGRIYNIGAYHLGQIALISGVIAQFGS
ncbi:MAG: lysoplasmalogenase [Chloroflexi bacterium]|nr:lysoplasmalogenase [Chloroflexota bacterium]